MPSQLTFVINVERNNKNDWKMQLHQFLKYDSFYYLKYNIKMKNIAS